MRTRKTRLVSVVLVFLVAMSVTAPLYSQDELGRVDSETIYDLLSDLQRRVQDLESTNNALERKVIDLQKRLDALETQLNPTPALPMQSDPLLRIEEIRAYEYTKEKAESDRIQNQIKLLEGQLTQTQSIQRSGNTTASQKRDARERGRALDREMGIAKAEFRKLEEFMEVDRFWVLGWDGNRDIMLWTEGDLKEMIQSLRIGAFVTWKGRKIDSALGAPRDSDFHTWTALSIDVIEAPLGFIERPQSRVPIWKRTPQYGGGRGTPTGIYPRLPDDFEPW